MTAPSLNNTLSREDDSPPLESNFNKAVQRVMGMVAVVGRYILKTPPLWIPLLFLGIATLIFRYTDADLFLARLFYHPHSVFSWPVGDRPPWIWLYDYGIYPAWVLGCGGLVIWLLAFIWKKVRPIRDEGLFFALLLILGPGLLINVISKPLCGRPRPVLSKPFGGEYEFLSVFTLGENVAGTCNSFPSGHASTGFYLMAPAFVFYRRRNGWAAFFLLFGIAAGCIIGIARMANGAHFASDVLWAGGFVYFTGLLLAAIFRFGTRGKNYG
jgi:lipid A 4'-phosphatase